MWEKIWNAIRSIIEKMIGTKSVEQALHVMPIISNKMEESIKLWDNMYKNESPWLHEPNIKNPIKVVSLGLASSIASEKARTATIEMKTCITEPNEAVMDKDRIINQDFIPSTRAEYLNKQYQLNLIPHIRRQLEYGIAKGGLVIKPFIYETANSKDIHFTFCQADEFYPIAFDSTGQMTEAAFIERLSAKGVVYTRVEYHKFNPATNVVTVINKAYKTIQHDTGNKENELGTEIKLTDIEQWKNIAPEVNIKDVDRLLFAYFKMPDANNIDATSPLGVSAYSKAVGLIKEADIQFSRLMWEYEGGEMAVDIDLDALNTQEATINGQIKRIEIPTEHQARLFRKIDLGAEDTYKVFNPALRDASYQNGLNNILMRIEDVCSISRGTFSDITRSEAKTATEILVMRQRSYASNADIQKALQKTLDDVIYIMDVLCTLYELFADGEYTVSYEWDDSLITNPEEELQRRLTLVQAGMESKLNLRMWYFGETEEQARAQLAVINQEELEMAQIQATAQNMVQPVQETIE